MNNTSKSLNIITLIFLVLSFAVALLRGFVLINFVDEIGLYTNDVAAGAFLACMVLIALAVIAVYFFLKAKGFADVYPADNTKLKKAAFIMCAISFVCLSATEVMKLIGSGVLSQIQFVLCAFSALYFIIAVFKNKKHGSSSAFFGVFGLVPALWAALRAICIFMDVTTQINSSERSLILTLTVCVMIMFINEAEMFKPLAQEEKVKAEKDKRSAKSYAFALAVISFSLIVFVSHIMMLIFTGEISDASGIIISAGSGVYAVSILTVCRNY